MKITDLHIDGFGVWSDVGFHSLSPEITVFYGPNEAGKSTLLQFVRSICFGFTPERRGFVTRVQAGRAGGWLKMVNERGRYQVARHDEGIAATSSFGTLKITSGDGGTQSEGQLRSLLGNLDEATFNNVFAVGLREIQELGTLSDTAAAQYLYDLSAGRDRVSLSEVLRELDVSRERLTGTPERPSLLADLVTQRDRLQQEIDELRSRTPRYGRVAAQGVGLTQSYSQVEAEIGQWQRKIRLLDLAAVLRGKWHERNSLDQQLSVLDRNENLPGDLLHQLERLNFRLRRIKQRRAKVVGEFRVLKGEAAAININDNLWKNGSKIEALAEQAPWSSALEKQIQVLETELVEHEANYEKRREALSAAPAVNTLTITPAHGAQSHAVQSNSGRRSWSQLQPLAQRMKRTRREYQDAQEAHAKQQKRKDEIQSTVGAKLNGRSAAEVMADVEKTGQLVTNLRRRIQLEDKLQQLTRQRAEVEKDANEGFEEMILPPWLLSALGALFILGVVLILAGLASPAASKLGWIMSILGLVGTAVIGGAKWFFEFNAEAHANDCDKQLELITSQLTKLETERSDLDGVIPKGGGSFTSRLQAAESQLATLQQILPAGATQTVTEIDMRGVEERLSRAEEEYQKARSGWKKALRSAGFDENLSPADIAQKTQEEERLHNNHREKQLATEREQQRLVLEQNARRDELASLERNVLTKREELNNRRREWESAITRVRHTLADIGLLGSGKSPFDQLVLLRKELQEQRALMERKRSILRKRKTLHREAQELVELAKKQNKRRTHLLRQANLSGYSELRQRLADQSRLDELKRSRDDLAKEITSALSGEFTEEALKEHLGANPNTFETSRKESHAKLQAAQTKLAALAQQRGEWLQQSKATQSDRRLQQKQLELSCVEKKLESAIEHWQVLAMTHSVLEATRKEFETERQPEALREASGYFEKLTNGKYRRVWTPFGENTLCVDEANGQSWSVDKLSRGTREQLFLALRLALVAQYHRRGVQVPLVLDDVLVNYDTARAAAAARVLREFAAQGHQLLVFTCHEHILDVFRELHVDCRHLRGEILMTPAEPPVMPEPVVVEPTPAPVLLPVIKEPLPPLEEPKRRVRRERPVKREMPAPAHLVAELPPIPRPILQPVAPAPVIEVAPLPQVVVRQEIAPPKPIVIAPAPIPEPVVVRAPIVVEKKVERIVSPPVTPVVVPVPTVLRKPRLDRVAVTPPISPLVVTEPRRVDPPQTQTHGVRYMHRNKWLAEEFDGELEDWVAIRAHDISVPATKPVPVNSRTISNIRPGFAPTTIVEQVEVVQPKWIEPERATVRRVVESRSRVDLPEIVIERRGAIPAYQRGERLERVERTVRVVAEDEPIGTA